MALNFIVIIRKLFSSLVQELFLRILRLTLSMHQANISWFQFDLKVLNDVFQGILPGRLSSGVPTGWQILVLFRCKLLHFDSLVSEIHTHALQLQVNLTNRFHVAVSGTRGDSRVCHWCSYHILTSSVIYYWTDAWQHGIYLFYIIKKQFVFL